MPVGARRFIARSPCTRTRPTAIAMKPWVSRTAGGHAPTSWRNWRPDFPRRPERKAPESSTPALPCNSEAQRLLVAAPPATTRFAMLDARLARRFLAFRPSLGPGGTLLADLL